jgi:hypothetical protein
MSTDDRLQRVESAIGRIELTHDRIADSLERLVRLETMHAETRQSVDRAFRHSEEIAVDIDAKLAEIGARLTKLEERQPVISLAVHFVGLVVLGALATVGAAVLKGIGMGETP